MSQENLSDRFISAFMGAIFGAIIGLILAWLFGVYSQTMGSRTMSVDWLAWVRNSAILLALLGFFLGKHIGTLAGTILNAIFQFENPQMSNSNGWIYLIVAVVLLLLFFNI